MRIPNFSITNQRSIRLASCDAMPRVMIITGPNGSGKSTLLNALRQAQGTPGPILYVGPHRTSRRQKVRARFLFQSKIKMSQLISQPSLPSYEGINIPNRNRDAWDFDESSNFLKYGLCQIELDRQVALAERFDASNEILKDSLPDIWSPLRGMTEHLLPHLHFYKIDVANRDQIRCLWKVHTKDIIVDIDDLSSGEKSIIQLFFPLIENRIQSLIDEIKGSKTKIAEENVCVLMDEPELHLHPVLQGKILDYIRTISIRESVQFVLATHSPTLVEHANSEELFLLRPSELVDGDHNQLMKVASDDEKLEVIREVFGSTSNVTAMRPLLVVEGRKSDKTSKRSSDARVYSFLSEDFNRVTIIPGGGKSECKKLAESLNELSAEFSEKIKAYSLLDRDLTEGEPEEEYSIYLPVSMIENLLVDPDVIWNALATVVHKTEFSSVEDVSSALDVLLDEMEKEEVSRRIKDHIGVHTFRAKDPVDTIQKQIQKYSEGLNEIIADGKFERLSEDSTGVVQKLKEENKRREYFHGKNILSTFYKQYCHATGMSKEIFIYECARQASNRDSVNEFVSKLFGKVEQPSSIEE